MWVIALLLLIFFPRIWVAIDVIGRAYFARERQERERRREEQNRYHGLFESQSERRERHRQSSKNKIEIMDAVEQKRLDKIPGSATNYASVEVSFDQDFVEELTRRKYFGTNANRVDLVKAKWIQVMEKAGYSLGQQYPYGTFATKSTALLETAFESLHNTEEEIRTGLVRDLPGGYE